MKKFTLIIFLINFSILQSLSKKEIIVIGLKSISKSSLIDYALFSLFDHYSMQECNCGFLQRINHFIFITVRFLIITNNVTRIYKALHVAIEEEIKKNNSEPLQQISHNSVEPSKHNQVKVQIVT